MTTISKAEVLERVRNEISRLTKILEARTLLLWSSTAIAMWRYDLDFYQTIESLLTAPTPSPQAAPPTTKEREEMLFLIDKVERKLVLPQGKKIARKIRTLILAPPSVTRPKIICFCGSVRFSTEMMIVAWEYAKAGKIVLSWCVLPDSYFAAYPDSRGDDSAGVHAAEKEGVREILDEVHKRKIDLADEILVINVGGYVGDSTKSEIQYAIDHGKPVRWLEPDSADAILAALPDDKPQ